MVLLAQLAEHPLNMYKTVACIAQWQSGSLVMNRSGIRSSLRACFVGRECGAKAACETSDLLIGVRFPAFSYLDGRISIFLIEGGLL